MTLLVETVIYTVFTDLPCGLIAWKKKTFLPGSSDSTIASRPVGQSSFLFSLELWSNLSKHLFKTFSVISCILYSLKLEFTYIFRICSQVKSHHIFQSKSKLCK